ncbi:MAG TPA: hypothetical protein VH165_25255 [Kofleriaceae bacterium]|nr:hypothetical protein [Kofleriaceae bacterium]
MVAATVSLSHESAYVASELPIDDTKPERLSPRKLSNAAGAIDAPSRSRDHGGNEASGLITTPLTAEQIAEITATATPSANEAANEAENDVTNDVSSEATSEATSETTRDVANAATSKIARINRDDILTKRERLIGRQLTETAGVTVAETLTESVVVHDRVIVDTRSSTTVRLTATPVTEVIPATRPAPAAPAADSAPTAVDDDPSDGVIIQHITTADTAPVKRRRHPPSEPPEDDRPGDATGEITMPRARPSIDPRQSEPSILVADLATIHAQVGDVTSGQVTAPTRATRDAGTPAQATAPTRATRDAGTPAQATTVDAVRNDAVVFSEIEEAFFRAGHEVAGAPAAESFDDLDVGYRKVGFWDRLRGKAPRPVDLSDELTAAKPVAPQPAVAKPVAPQPAAAKPATSSPAPKPASPPASDPPAPAATASDPPVPAATASAKPAKPAAPAPNDKPRGASKTRTTQKSRPSGKSNKKQ